MINFDEMWNLIDATRTSTFYSAWKIEKQQLMEFLLGPGRYAIEIGSLRGATSRALGIVCKALNKRLICIDPWESEKDFEQYSQAVADLKDTVIAIKARSSNALELLPSDLPGDVCLVFVDGDHIYPQPLYDMLNYWPLISQGGVLAIHDIFDGFWHSGVFQSIAEFFRDKPGYCLRAINYIPSLEEASDAEHHMSGLIWVSKGDNCKPAKIHLEAAAT